MTLSTGRTTAALAALFLGTFVMGTAELVVVGVLDLISADVHVSIGAAGALVTSYALGLALGGPVLAALTIRPGRRPLLLGSVAAYLVVTVASVATTSFPVLITARVVTGSIHGLVVGLSFTIATSIVPPERIGRAISAVLGGFAVSAAVGVPLGTLVGQGLGWRGSFLAVGALGAVLLVALAMLVPPVAAPAATAGAQLRHALAPRVLAVLGLAGLMFAGQYAALTYIGPFLAERTGVSGELVSAFLLAYGAATAVGAFAGGRFADHRAARTILTGNAILVVALAVLALVGDVPALVVVTLVVWGVTGIGLVPSVQFRVVRLAGPGRDLAATLPASAINLGIAAGSLAGGWAVTAHGATAPAVTGVVLLVLALPVAWWTRRLAPVPAQDSSGIVDSSSSRS